MRLVTVAFAADDSLRRLLAGEPASRVWLRPNSDGTYRITLQQSHAEIKAAGRMPAAEFLARALDDFIDELEAVALPPEFDEAWNRFYDRWGEYNGHGVDTPADAMLPDGEPR